MTETDTVANQGNTHSRGSQPEGHRIAITGATGMIGGLILNECLEREDVAAVTTIGRRGTGRVHAKLREEQVDDFSDLAALQAVLQNHDVAYFCLGAYTGQVPDEDFRRITVDYVEVFEKAFLAASPDATAFCLLSGQGADQSERSSMAFARYKGAAEKALLSLGFPEVSLFRPGYIYPVEKRVEPNRTYRIFRALYPVLGRVIPNIGLSSVDLARAMVHGGLNHLGTPSGTVLENRDIRALAASLG